MGAGKLANNNGWSNSGIYNINSLLIINNRLKACLMRIVVVLLHLFLISEFGGSLNVRAITDFIDGGGNVLVATSSAIG